MMKTNNQTNKWRTRWKTRGEKISIHRQHDGLYKKIPINLQKKKKKTHKTPRIYDFSKIKGQKVNTQELITFLYTSNK